MILFTASRKLSTEKLESGYRAPFLQRVFHRTTGQLLIRVPLRVKSHKPSRINRGVRQKW